MKAMYPGSFDPLHIGHVQVIEAAASIFDEVVVVAMYNPSKPDGFFTLEERQAMIIESFQQLSNISTASSDGLAVHAAKEVGAGVIVKGLRGIVDFETEMQMAATNRSVTGIETMFIPTRPGTSFISSRYIREIAKRGESVIDLVPEPVENRLAERLMRGTKNTKMAI